MSEKVTKKHAEYHPAVATNRRCGVCTMYRTGGTCTKVEGDIGVDMVCDKYFEHKRTPYK